MPFLCPSAFGDIIEVAQPKGEGEKVRVRGAIRMINPAVTATATIIY